MRIGAPQTWPPAVHGEPARWARRRLVSMACRRPADDAGGIERADVVGDRPQQLRRALRGQGRVDRMSSRSGFDVLVHDVERDVRVERGVGVGQGLDVVELRIAFLGPDRRACGASESGGCLGARRHRSWPAPRWPRGPRWRPGVGRCRRRGGCAAAARGDDDRHARKERSELDLGVHVCVALLQESHKWLPWLMRPAERLAVPDRVRPEGHSAAVFQSGGPDAGPGALVPDRHLLLVSFGPGPPPAACAAPARSNRG